MAIMHSEKSVTAQAGVYSPCCCTGASPRSHNGATPGGRLARSSLSRSDLCEAGPPRNQTGTRSRPSKGFSGSETSRHLCLLSRSECIAERLRRMCNCWEWPCTSCLLRLPERCWAKKNIKQVSTQTQSLDLLSGQRSIANGLRANCSDFKKDN